MRALLAFIISLVIHVCMIWLLPYHAEPIIIPSDQLRLVVNSNSTQLQSLKLKQITNTSHIKEAELLTPPPAAKYSLVSKSPTAISDSSARYFSTFEVDRKALPISNIDISKFENIFLSGVAVRLRLYINASGKVDKIVRNSSLEQDEEMINRLENLLYEMTFIPARKNGSDVESYQDIEFTFNPVMTASPEANRVN